MKLTTKLTNSETLVLLRRRRKLTQRQFAKKFKVSVSQYCRNEKGTEAKIEAVLEPAKLEAHEECFILRRRKDWTQARVAKKLKVCRNWLNLMERGLKNPEALIAFWKNQ